ncbi:MAG: DsbA family protein [Candidatus Spechtbacterales bacterium]
MEHYIEKYAVPGSILIAGLIIGLGIMMSGNVSVGNDTASLQNPQAIDSGDIAFAPVGESDHIRGNANAEITLIEYSDLECPFCQSVHPTLEQLVADYDGKVRWVYRHFPLDSIHPQARPAAEASECVAELGGNNAFWAFIDGIFEDPATQLPLMRNVALATGVNASEFDSCVASGKYSEVVEGNISDGVGAGVTGTPHTLVLGPDGEVIPMVGAQPIGAFKTVIDEMLK